MHCDARLKVGSNMKRKGETHWLCRLIGHKFDLVPAPDIRKRIAKSGRDLPDWYVGRTVCDCVRCVRREMREVVELKDQG